MDMDEAWASTCRVLFGGEIGPMKGYDEYLSRYVALPAKGKSALSGKEIAVGRAIPKGAKFISNSEMAEFEKKTGSSPVNINDVKDTDSLVRALREKFHYAGNMQLGNCTAIEGSNKCIDSAFVGNSEYVYYSKYVSHSTMVRHSEYVFGTNSTAEIKFGIKHYETWRSVRMLEAFRTYTSSDCHFVANLESCQNCLFCFNLRNQSNCIGNLKLEKGKFETLKAKLVADIRDTLASKKTMPSIVDLVGGIA